MTGQPRVRWAWCLFLGVLWSLPLWTGSIASLIATVTP